MAVPKDIALKINDATSFDFRVSSTIKQDFYFTEPFEIAAS